MGRNNNLYHAKNNKNDEFYTMMNDVVKEIIHYEHLLYGKHIYCCCDDPRKSNIWLYFAIHFDRLGLKQLTSMHYSPNGTFRTDIHKHEENNHTIINQNHHINVFMTFIEGDGDFRSIESENILKECDIVVTNPPFSLFREFINHLIHYDRHFLVIGNLNAISYSDIFKYIMEGRISTGINHGSFKFEVPYSDDNEERSGFIEQDGRHYIKLGNINWFTDIMIDKESNFKFNSLYDPTLHRPFDNYQAINIDRIKDIPANYYGLMGVPITFINHYDPEMFEIIGITNGRSTFSQNACPTMRYINPKQHDKDGTIKNGSKLNTRGTMKVDDNYKGIYYTVDNIDYPLRSIYARILIRRR